MNKHFSEFCSKCKNQENCYVSEILSSDLGYKFDIIKLSECQGFVENTPNIIQISTCKDCKNKSYTDSAYFCEIHKMSKNTYKQIFDINTIPNWCKLLK